MCICREKRAWHYSQFQASNRHLGTHLPWIRGDYCNKFLVWFLPIQKKELHVNFLWHCTAGLLSSTTTFTVGWTLGTSVATENVVRARIHNAERNVVKLRLMRKSTNKYLVWEKQGWGTQEFNDNSTFAWVSGTFSSSRIRQKVWSMGQHLAWLYLNTETNPWCHDSRKADTVVSTKHICL